MTSLKLLGLKRLMQQADSRLYTVLTSERYRPLKCSLMAASAASNS